jgi:GNAT superfamily N-acetyltransferase
MNQNGAICYTFKRKQEAPLISGYTFTSDVYEMDIPTIHRYLTRSYWAKGIPLETVTQAVENSLCVGILTPEGEQVAFGRVVTDRATFGYLSDVFVLEEHQGRGLGKELIKEILAHPDLQGLRRIVLATGDAHGLYVPFGFEALGSPEMFMERHQPDAYGKTS